MSGPGSLAAALDRQVAANRSGTGHEEHFTGHRARLTGAILERAPAGIGREPEGGRLCLLGVGNANDVDLEALAARFAEVHLVDLDADAVAGACARVSADRRARLIVHAPVDVSGLFTHLDAWSRTPPAVEAIADAVEEGVAGLEALLGGPFDLVVSCCLLSQLQRVLLEVVGDRHLRFEELRAAVNHVHVLGLAGLVAAGGRALLVTDLTSNETYPPLDHLPDDANLGALMSDLVHAGNVMAALHPGILSGIIRHDDELRARYEVRFPVGPWLWHNGPAQTYLVYGLEIAPRTEIPDPR